MNDIRKKIEQLRARQNSLRAGLPYADHGAYGQDLMRINDAETEIKALQRQLDQLTSAK